jgi:hypothetical protein
VEKEKENKMVEVNSEKSYLGREIREWCLSNTTDEAASEIARKYYSDEVEFKPSDRVYYFVEYVSPSESYRECGSLNMYGCRLQRDLEKSPRKNADENTNSS